MSELKPCPLGHDEASFGTITYSKNDKTSQLNGQFVWHFVNCGACSWTKKLLHGHKTREDAAKHWNTRTAPSSEDWEKGLNALCTDDNWFHTSDEPGGPHTAWRGEGEPDEIARAIRRALTSASQPHSLSNEDRPITNPMSTDVKLVDKPALTPEDVERIFTSVHGDPGFQPIDLDGSGFDAWLITSDLLPTIADQINTALTEGEDDDTPPHSQK